MSLWPEIRRRRRWTRLQAAWHLLRHGAVVYGVTVHGELLSVDTGNRQALICRNVVVPPPSISHNVITGRES